jgi:hypothetical protein
MRLLTALIATLLVTLLPRPSAALEQTPPSDVCNGFDNDWTPVERFVWAGLCKQGVAILNPRGSENERRLTASFVESIIRTGRYQERAKAQGVLIRNAIVTGALRVHGTSFEGAVTFEDCVFRGVVDFSYSNFSNDVRFIRTDMLEGFIADYSRLGRLELASTTDRAMTVKMVSVTGTQIRGDLTIFRAAVAGKINLASLESRGAIIRESKVHETSLALATIAGQIVLVDSEFSPSRATQEELLNLFSIRTTQGVFLNRSIVHGRINLESAVIDDWLRLVGAELHSIDAKGITIKSALVVGDVRPGPGGASKKTTWTGPEPYLDLSYANVGVISTPYDLDYWPPTIRLKNFSARAFEFAWYSPERNERRQVAEWAVSWLARQKEFESQPYYRTRQILLDSGDEGAAAAVGYAARDRELAEAWKERRLGKAAYLTFSKFVIGYGYQIWLAIIWVVIFTAAGAIVFRRTPEAHRTFMPYGLAYSFDTLLPLIKLRERHYEIDIAGPTRYYFFVHKLAGWILGSFIVAGLSGLTK